MEIAKNIWIDGEIKKLKDVLFPLTLHSLHYGSAVFEGLRFYGTEEGRVIFRLKDHVNRLACSAKAIQFPLRFQQEEIFNAVKETIQANNLTSGYIRILGFFGEGDMELHPNHASLHLAIMLWPWAPRMGNDSISLMTSSFVRTSPSSTILSAKLSGNYINSVLARQEAKAKGFHEALLLDEEGNVAEASGANFFLVKEGRLITPPFNRVFPGVTRDSVISIANSLKIPVCVRNVQPKEIFLADEVFLSGTAVQIISVRDLDKLPIQNAKGKITALLKEQFHGIIAGKVSGFSSWLTPV